MRNLYQEQLHRLNQELIQMGAACEEIIKEFGGADILVNNAGITKDGLLMRMSDDDWDAVLNVNLKGTFLFTRAVSRPMMKNKDAEGNVCGGSIINIASVVGIMGNAGQANYTASKGGVIALTKTTAKELGSRNVRCNAVAPGFIQSTMTCSLGLGHSMASDMTSASFTSTSFLMSDMMFSFSLLLMVVLTA